jgi:ABC-2 type transport system permease protein
MRKILRLVKREYKAAVKTKGFIIGIILAPVFMGGGIIAFALLKDSVDTTDKRIAIIDRSAAIAESLVKDAESRNKTEIYDEKTGGKIKPAYLFEIVEPDEEEPEVQKLELSNRIRRGELHAFIEIAPDVVHPRGDPGTPRVAYHAKNAAMDNIRGWVNWPINKQLRQLRLADAGIDESSVSDLFTWINAAGLGLVSVNEETGSIKGAQRADKAEAVAVPVVMMFLIYLMIMMSVPGMLHSVMEEKTQRIAEVLLGSVKPFEFMMAKVIGGIAVSLTTSSIYIVGGILVVNYMDYGKYIPYHILPWFFVYMLLAIIMMGAMTTALGSTCSEAKDAQSLMFPSILPAILPMFVYFMVIREPMSGFATWISLIPTFTPTLMLLRQTTPAGIPLWQPVAGLLGMILFTFLSVWAGGRIFRVAILMQGTPPKLSNMIRWAIRG